MKASDIVTILIQLIIKHGDQEVKILGNDDENHEYPVEVIYKKKKSFILDDGGFGRQ